jgi:hypothetical protein
MQGDAEPCFPLSFDELMNSVMRSQVVSGLFRYNSRKCSKLHDARGTRPDASNVKGLEQYLAVLFRRLVILSERASQSLDPFTYEYLHASDISYCTTIFHHE